MRWYIWWVDLDILLVPLPGHPPEVIQAPSRYPQDTHIIYSLHIALVAPGYSHTPLIGTMLLPLLVLRTLHSMC